MQLQIESVSGRERRGGTVTDSHSRSNCNGSSREMSSGAGKTPSFDRREVA